MKIYINMTLDFSATAVDSSHFSFDFNWMTDSGIIAGGTNKKINVPFNLTADSYNQAIINAVTSAINASGKYTVHTGDKLILLGGFTTIVTH